MPIHMRLPKLKGFKKYNQVVYEVVNVADLEKYFPQGGTITIKDLQDRRIVKKRRPVKVLGDGDLSVKFDITANKFSKSAKEKIEAAGGSVTEVYFAKADKTGRSLKEED